MNEHVDEDAINLQWLEMLRESFDIALAEDNDELCRELIKDAMEHNFYSEAKVMLQELNANKEQSYE